MAWNPIVKLGDLEINTERLAEFVVEAKKNIYSNSREGKEIILPDGSKQLTFQKGNFHYTNAYSGYLRFAGNEKVRWEKPEGQLIWQMNYLGEVWSKFFDDKEFIKKIFEFLEKSLSQIPSDVPFRGPTSFSENLGENVWKYSCSTQGLNSIESFEGKERIIISDKKGPTITKDKGCTKHHFGIGQVYSGQYHGGIIR